MKRDLRIARFVGARFLTDEEDFYGEWDVCRRNRWSKAYKRAGRAKAKPKFVAIKQTGQGISWQGSFSSNCIARCAKLLARGTWMIPGDLFTGATTTEARKLAGYWGEWTLKDIPASIPRALANLTGAGTALPHRKRLAECFRLPERYTGNSSLLGASEAGPPFDGTASRKDRRKENGGGKKAKLSTSAALPAKAALKKIMERGSSAPWQETLREAIGEDRLDAAALREYFRPLEDWLRTENLRTGDVVGWSYGKKVNRCCFCYPSNPFTVYPDPRASRVIARQSPNSRR
ncbi:Angiotensin-converting enzyme [Eufriesea mexicana]|uniref:Angiotensin-converting enzyme n=1 Tax=Eufriesea mexicana TaxID=516756 RepID=A0A310S4J3_9HYME|nr:Angiotensin-converting enzyme [Eufriesea mexicana]